MAIKREIKFCKICKGEPSLKQNEGQLLWVVKCICGREGSQECSTTDAIADWDRKQ